MCIISSLLKSCLRVTADCGVVRQTGTRHTPTSGHCCGVSQSPRHTQHSLYVILSQLCALHSQFYLIFISDLMGGI